MMQLIVVEASGLLPGEGTVKPTVSADELALLITQQCHVPITAFTEGTIDQTDPHRDLFPLA